MYFCHVFGLSHCSIWGSHCGAAGPFSTTLVAKVNWWSAGIGVAIMTVSLTQAQRREEPACPSLPHYIYIIYIYIKHCFRPQFHDTLFLMGRNKNSRMVWSGKIFCLHPVIQCHRTAWVGDNHKTSICFHGFMKPPSDSLKCVLRKTAVSLIYVSLCSDAIFIVSD